MSQLSQEYSERFSEIFRTITTDNGSDFADFSSAERNRTKVYFTEPYSAWERPVNKLTNRFLRRYTPKGISIHSYSTQEISQATDEINAMSRK